MDITGGLGGETALFTDTQGPVTGCSRITEAGSPEASAVAAAAGNPGQMFVDGGKPVAIQSGGVGYSANLTPVLASTGGHVAGYNRYVGDGLRSDLNQHESLPLMSAGGKKYKKTNSRKAGKSRNNLRKLRKTAKRFATRNLRRANKLQKAVRSTARKGMRKVKKYVGVKTVRVPLPVPVLKKLTGGRRSRTHKNFRKHSSKRFGRLVAHKGARPPFFVYGGEGHENAPVNVVNTEQRVESEHSGQLVYGGKRTVKKGKKLRGGCGSCGGYDGGSINNVPLSFGHSVGGVELSSSALASPPPVAGYSHCSK